MNETTINWQKITEALDNKNKASSIQQELSLEEQKAYDELLPILSMSGKLGHKLYSVNTKTEHTAKNTIREIENKINDLEEHWINVALSLEGSSKENLPQDKTSKENLSFSEKLSERVIKLKEKIYLKKSAEEINSTIQNIKAKVEELKRDNHESNASSEELEILVSKIKPKKELDSNQIGDRISKMWDKVDAYEKSKTSHSPPKQIKIQPEAKNKLKVWMIAASIAVILGVLGVFNQKIFNTSIEYAEYKADKIKQITLPDRSQVWLGKGSTIKYAVSFENLENRKILLEGDAFFNVRKNPEKPFIVETNQGKVEVLGTSFKVNATENTKGIEVAVIEGKVKVELKSLAVESPIILKKNQKVEVLGSNTSNIEKLNAEQTSAYAKYTREELYFKNTPLEEVFEILGIAYGKEFKIADSNISQMGFNGKYSESTLKEILSSIEIAANLKIIEKQDKQLEVLNNSQ